MSDLDDIKQVRDVAESVFADAWDSTSVGFDARLWRTCEELGLARLTLPEAAGGSGASFAQAAAVLQAAGRFAARIPLVETDLVGGWLLHTVGLPVPAGPLSATSAVDLELTGREGDLATGTLRRVPWGRTVAAVAVVAGDKVLLVDPANADVDEGANLAEEPRDDLRLTGTAVRVADLPPTAAEELRLRAALGRSQLMAGAMHQALAMSVRYATERVQFGRPLAKLQTIQQMLALAAAEVTAAGTAAQAAAAEVDAVGFDGAALAIAAAKSRCGEAAGVVVRTAHQVHGALGFTREHDLRLVTTRLSAWRDEDGSEAHWNDVLGGRALTAGPSGLWPMLSARAAEPLR